jgi:TatD DNase family protein
MKLPQPDDYINIHTHQVKPAKGIFAVENLMAHENLDPAGISAGAFTAGIHPWHLNENNRDQLLEYVRKVSCNSDLIAFGEAGFDKLRGPAMELQKTTFEEQVQIACENQKPLIIHCVRAWNELLAAHKNLKPSTPWLVHGFRGKKELASQLLARGMYISLWFDFVMRPQSAELLRFLPKDRFFLETDGADVDIREIYRKVSDDLEIDVNELKKIIHNNFMVLFGNMKLK